MNARIDEVYFDQEPTPEALRFATASAFGLRMHEVVVERLDGPASVGSEPMVRWLRDADLMPGEFPVWYYLHTPAELTLGEINRALSEITHQLTLAAVSEAADPDSLALHGPDGSLRDVPIVQIAADDYAIRLAPSDRAILERAYAQPARLAS